MVQKFQIAFLGRAVRLISAAGWLAACSGGGGGSPASSVNSGSSGNAGSSSGAGASTTPIPPAIPTISAPGAITLGGGTPNVATGSTPSFTPAGAPPQDTVLVLTSTAVKLNQPTLIDAGIGGSTYTTWIPAPSLPTYGQSGGLKVPSIGLDVPSTGGQPNGGGFMDGGFSFLNYTMMGAWSFQPPAAGGGLTSHTFFGYSVGGFQTPSAGLPASGSATFNGNGSPTNPQFAVPPNLTSAGGAAGLLFIPMPGSSITLTRVAGDVSVTANFSSGAVTGSLTNMKFLSSGNSFATWNDVNLSGTLSGSRIAGTTSTAGPPPNLGNAGFASNSTGTFNGALYGPNAQELGAVWTLYDPSGKAALGVIGAKK